MFPNRGKAIQPQYSFDLQYKLDEFQTSLVSHFDQLRNEYNTRLDAMDKKQNELNEQVVSLFDQLRNEYNARLDAIDQRQNELRELMDVRNLHYDMMFWQLYRQPDETSEDAKKRFFLSLPKAQKSLRLLQLGDNFLLKQLMDICKKNGLQIWLSGGTLLGAYRHKGFIPWDDDVDTNMMRDEIEKLREILNDNPNYCITSVYDYIAKCRQIRFRFRDQRVQCFVDIFCMDYCVNDSDSIWKKQKELRNELVQKLDSDISELKCWKEKIFIKSGENESDIIQQIFDEYNVKMMNCGILTSKEKAGAILFSLDNLTVNFQNISKIDQVFPLSHLEFEGCQLSVPKQFKLYLSKAFGDIYKLPNDILWHTHVTNKEMETEEMRDALKKILQIQNS